MESRRRTTCDDRPRRPLRSLDALGRDEVQVRDELLADLDHNLYARRQKASEALAALGTVVRSALQQHRTTAPAEARQRIDDLLKWLDQTELTPEMLRQVRAVEALERTGTPEARAVLEKLGQGAADALLTREARAALGRMK